MTSEGRHGPEYFAGTNENVDHLNVIAMAAYGSVATDLETLLKFGADFPESVKNTVRSCAEISGDDMKDLVSIATTSLNAAHQSGLVYSDQEKQKFLRKQIGEEIVERIERYLNEQEVPFGDSDVNEEVAGEFTNALKALLLK